MKTSGQVLKKKICEEVILDEKVKWFLHCKEDGKWKIHRRTYEVSQLEEVRQTKNNMSEKTRKRVDIGKVQDRGRY